jgi:DNA polymerase-3 subunit epsilon
MIEAGAASSASGASRLTTDATALDLSTVELILVEPDEHERAEHERVLAELDKASGGKTVWRLLVS